MPRNVDYYFSVASPWAYIGYGAFLEIARRYDLGVAYKPLALGQVFEQTGGLPLPKRHPARQRYRMVELQRWRDRRGLRFNLKPKHWPFDATLVDRTVIAILQAGEKAETFLRLAHAAVWEQERDMTDETTVAALLREAGLDPSPLMARAGSPEIAAVHGRNLDEAIAAGVFGAPSYVVEGEIFWGQDRLDLLDAMLASGRDPYRPV